MSDVSQLLSAIKDGDPHAADKLLPLVYAELRRLAAEKMAHEKPGQTLQPTALVHEAYLRLVAADPLLAKEKAEGVHWDSRGHFFAAAAEAMRRILIDNARRKRALKHGGTRARQELNQVQPLTPEPREDLLALDEALTAFAIKHPVKADLVKLRYFAGLTSAAAAAALGISTSTAERYWTFARAWLHRHISQRV